MTAAITSTNVARKRWSQDPVEVPAEEVAAYTDELRMAGRTYKIGWNSDGSAVIIAQK